MLKRLKGDQPKKEKIDTHVSGSLVENKEASKLNIVVEKPLPEIPTTDMIDHDQVDKIMEKILDLAWVDNSLRENLSPAYYLDCKDKTVWLYSVSRMTFLPIPSGIEITPLDQVGNNKIKCIVGNDIYEIDAKMVKTAGWN